MKGKSMQQPCAFAAPGVPRHAACSMCAFNTCTALLMSVCARKNREVQV